MPPPTTDPAPLHARPRQLDLLQDLPGGDMLLLLAELEQEVMKASARGRVPDLIRELSAIRDGLGGVGSGPRLSRVTPAERAAPQPRPRRISNA